MGAGTSSLEGIEGRTAGIRGTGFTAGKAVKGQARQLPSYATAVKDDDIQTILDSLAKVMIFQNLDDKVQMKIIKEMYERPVKAGEILIREGDTGLGASELYVVKSGTFEVLERRRGQNFRVNSKGPGNVFGEIALMYNVARTATVAALNDGAVWVLERPVFRTYIQEGAENKINELEVFLNSVPLLNSLNKEERIILADAMEEKKYEKDQRVITQGEPGDFFYIVRDGEAMVVQTGETGQQKKLNHLFRSDYFGEMALLKEEPRMATVIALNTLKIVRIDRATFRQILGPLEELMKRDKSNQVVFQKMMRLQAKTVNSKIPAEVVIKRKVKKDSGETVEQVVRARGHLDEVMEIRVPHVAANQVLEVSKNTELLTLTLVEGQVLGGGAFSRVSIVTELSTGRQYALKRMKKIAVMQCPDHVFCEQAITRNISHPFCIRQYSSFQDKYHLYFLFDLMSGGDLMDILVSEAKVIKVPVPKGMFRRGCFARKQKQLVGMNESLARFYVGSIAMALEYLHENKIVYRDLKPENVFVDSYGYIKLGDFGFAKVLDSGKTFTFCGTPGYVAPENIMAQGYGYSVDWWGLGVLTYVLLTGKQPFSNPKSDDPMVIMRRIVDENWKINFPPYVSSAARDFILGLLERKPARRLGCTGQKAEAIKKHRWFEGFDWDALAARKLEAPRRPKDDAAKRIRELNDNELKNDPSEKKVTAEELQECQNIFAAF